MSVPADPGIARIDTLTRAVETGCATMPPRSLADELEDGSLREELFGPRPKPVAVAPALSRHVYRMTFTGSGGEYFRLWIVNLLLTLLTAGVYSAWAKVRKTRYFCQNTRLDGMPFDYHGSPVAILRGRLLAVLLLAAYSFGFEISATAGLVTVAVLLGVGPWLFLSAQQFRLRNSSHRGLRFGFTGTARGAYARLLPLLLVWFASSVLGLVFDLPSFAILLSALVVLVLFPLIHHELKDFQHANATYGDRPFAFAPARDDFYAVYLKALGILLPAAIGAALLTGAVSAWWLRQGGDPSTRYTFALGLLIGALLYLAGGPYVAARLQQIVWDHTRLPGMRFRTEIRAWPLTRIVAKNMLLTLATLGLYWPFAAVALARYRVEAFVVDSEVPIDSIAESTQARPASAAGEGAADLFGLDVGL
jgi:uncharacterized membrane protein YjgN (DUF898 family)